MPARNTGGLLLSNERAGSRVIAKSNPTYLVLIIDRLSPGLVLLSVQIFLTIHNCQLCAYCIINSPHHSDGAILLYLTNPSAPVLANPSNPALISLSIKSNSAPCLMSHLTLPLSMCAISPVVVLNLFRQLGHCTVPTMWTPVSKWASKAAGEGNLRPHRWPGQI